MGVRLITGEAPWRLVIGSASGTSHRATGAPCQDSAAHRFIEGPDGKILIAVICDGAGSAAHAEVGASLAAEAFISAVEEYLTGKGRLADVNRELATAWIKTVARRLEDEASSSESALREYACTLLAAVIGVDTAVFIQIGDGAIVVSHGPHDGWSYVFWPQHGEFANTTNFVVSPNACEVMDFELALRGVREIALFSDGIENLVLHRATKSVHERFFATMFPPVRSSQSAGLNMELSASLTQYLDSPVICDRTDDDKTLILATRVPPDSEPAV
jgi:hypothetical protein